MKYRNKSGGREVEGVGAGLCDACAHQRVIANTRGSRFSLCERSRSDPAYPRYPRIPVLRCLGYEAREIEPGPG